MRNMEVQTWLECIPEWDKLHIKHIGMFAWLRDLLESIAANNTEKLEATLAIKPYELYVDIVGSKLEAMAEVTALFENVDVNVLKAILIKYKNKFDKDLDFTYWCIRGDEKWRLVKLQMYLDILADVETHTHTDNNSLDVKDKYDIAYEEANKRLEITLRELHEKEKEDYYRLVRKLVFDTIDAAKEAHKNDKLSAYCAAIVFSRITDVWDKKLFAVKQKTIKETEVSNYLERMRRSNDPNNSNNITYGFEGISNAYFETREW